jgi:nucleotide-binding universal stress UspA family protein
MSVQHILALTDLSDSSIAGLDLAEALARRLHARITVGYAHTRSDILRDFVATESDKERVAEWVRKDDEEHLRHLAGEHIEKLRLAGIQTVDADSGREGVPMLIAQTQPDLVCMATRGRTGLKHLLLGSIAEHTIRTAGVPVCVAKERPMPRAEDPLRVLVGVDLIDDPAFLARRTAALLRKGDELVLGHIVESLYYSPTAYGTELALPQPDVPKLVEAASGRLESVELGADGPELKVAVAAGRPGEGMLALEKQHHPHLVAVRTHGRRGFDRMMLGSVSEFLARKSTASVLIFPKKG